MKSIEDIIKSQLELIETMVEKGATDKEISKKIGVGYSTFRKYKAQDEDIKQIMAQGKEKKNQAVEQAVYKCATGYHYYEDVVTKLKNEEVTEDGNIITKEEVKISSVKKYRGPDLAAQKYWLNNRKKASWKEDPNKVENDRKVLKLKEKEIASKTIDI